MSIPEQILLESWIRTRDGEAFRSLVDTYGSMVFASARRILGNVADAEDATQECFAALAGLKKPPKAPLGPWLHRVVVNSAFNRIKSGRARILREERFAPTAPPSQNHEWRELECILDEAIMELPEHLRAPLVAHYLMGKSHSAIAQEFGLSRQAVTYRTAKAIERLRSALRRKGVTLTGTALAAFLGSQTAEALSPALTLSLGKTALASACGAAQASTACVSLATKGVLTVTTASKIGIGLGTAVALVAAIWIGSMARMKSGNSQGNTSRAADRAIPAASHSTVGTRSSSSPEAQQSAPLAIPYAEATQIAPEQEPPITGLWQVVSYTWSATGDSQPVELFNPSHLPEGLVDPGVPPLARLSVEGSMIDISILEPWDRQAVCKTLSGTRDQFSVVLHAEGTDLPLVFRGIFNPTWTTLEAEGGYSLDVASKAYLQIRDKAPGRYAEMEASRFSISLKRLGDIAGIPAFAAINTLEKRRIEAEAFADALSTYAKSHEGALPAELSTLVAENLIPASLLQDEPHRKLVYTGGDLPRGLLKDSIPWDQFNTTDPIGERIAAWEVYQQKRWGKDEPTLSPALMLEFDDRYLQFSIDALGQIIERNYLPGTPGAEDTIEAKHESQRHLRALGVSLYEFMSEHDGVMPAGWCSLYPQYVKDTTIFTHPLGLPGTSSYTLLLPGVNLNEFAETIAAAQEAAGETPDASRINGSIPIAVEAHDLGTMPQGRCVLMGDGHTEYLPSSEFVERCEQLGIAVPQAQ